MPKIVITLSSENYTTEQLNDFVKIFAVANGWQEKVVKNQVGENGEVILKNEYPVPELDENGNPVLIDNPVTPIAFAALPAANYFRKVVVDYQARKIVDEVAKQAKDNINSALDLIKTDVEII